MKEVGIPNKLFPNQIKESEKHLYHVIIVESIADDIKKKFNFKVHHKKYNEKSFEVNKTQLAKLGYTDAHIIHDPSLVNLDKAPANKDKDLTEKEKTLVQKEADLKKREDAIAKKEAELKVKGDNNVPPPTVQGDVNFDVEKAKGNELKAFAEANSIDLKEASKVDDIREIVKTWLDNKRESEQK